MADNLAGFGQCLHIAHSYIYTVYLQRENHIYLCMYVLCIEREGVVVSCFTSSLPVCHMASLSLYTHIHKQTCKTLKNSVYLVLEDFSLLQELGGSTQILITFNKHESLGAWKQVFIYHFILIFLIIYDPGYSNS